METSKLLFTATKKCYRFLLPEKVRRSKRVKSFKSLLPHNLIYDSEYFERDVEGPAVASVAAMSRSIERDLAPRRIVDVGCGTGALLAAMCERGCMVMGLEYADTAIAFCRKRGVPVQKFNIEKDHFQSNTRFDAVISMEVAEHLPERTADRYVDLLTTLSDVAVFTAATPNQGGVDHVNEQPHNYWIEKFAERGFSFDETLSLQWRREWQESGLVASWYHANLMIFRKLDRDPTNAIRSEL